jgi:hypothetical protein
VYFKTYTGSQVGMPPNGGGGGKGFGHNITARNVILDSPGYGVYLGQNNSNSGDLPSTFQFSNLTFTNWTGTTSSSNRKCLTSGETSHFANEVLFIQWSAFLVARQRLALGLLSQISTLRHPVVSLASTPAKTSKI